MSINHFEFRYAYLSSRYPVTIKLGEFPGRVFPTADNAYWVLIYPDMMEKLSYSDGADIQEMLNTMNAIEANRHGTVRMVDTFRRNRAFIVPEDVKVNAMRTVTEAKFDQHPNLRAKLIKTNGHTLFYINTWEDTFWGVKVTDTRTYVGKNWLGRILMDLREAYLKETAG